MPVPSVAEDCKWRAVRPCAWLFLGTHKTSRVHVMYRKTHESFSKRATRSSCFNFFSYITCNRVRGAWKSSRRNHVQYISPVSFSSYCSLSTQIEPRAIPPLALTQSELDRRPRTLARRPRLSPDRGVNAYRHAPTMWQLAPDLGDSGGAVMGALRSL